jgi:dehydrogenase/reductase SDR family protein 12
VAYSDASHIVIILWFCFGFFFFLGHGTRGATVYLLCRNKERGEKAVENIRTKTGNPNVSLEVSFLAPL